MPAADRLGDWPGVGTESAGSHRRRIAGIAARIANGDYRVPVEAVAEAFLAFHGWAQRSAGERLPGDAPQTAQGIPEARIDCGGCPQPKAGLADGD